MYIECSVVLVYHAFLIAMPSFLLCIGHSVVLLLVRAGSLRSSLSLIHCSHISTNLVKACLILPHSKCDCYYFRCSILF